MTRSIHERKSDRIGSDLKSEQLSSLPEVKGPLGVQEEGNRKERTKKRVRGVIFKYDKWYLNYFLISLSMHI
ncbi:unnamed protein product [Onchocerca flexuosa]|uniref:Uncharacterized protein n=1 Tax=Onchocerca flexuosa TaxID=387005 RepID=A0A183I7B5_9BILA|nr:unnamed protein product [Onchocerca flexuosa]